MSNMTDQWVDVPIYAATVTANRSRDPKSPHPQHSTVLGFEPIPAMDALDAEGGLTLLNTPGSGDAPAFVVRSWDHPALVPGANAVMTTRRDRPLLRPADLLALAVDNDPSARLIVGSRSGDAVDMSSPTVTTTVKSPKNYAEAVIAGWAASENGGEG